MRIDYSPPPTIKAFISDYRPGELFYDWIVGPYGSGKTTGLFFKLCVMAGLQDKDSDGIRRTKAVIIRNTMPQLRDTTMASWNRWFKDGVAGEWRASENKFILRYNDVECEVLFRPLDTPADIARVLSLEVSFALIDEFVQIPREIIDALSARLGRYPAEHCTNWGMWGSSNPDTEDSWWFDFLHNELPKNARYFHQPSGFSEEAENIEHLPGGREYYTRLAEGKSDAWVKQFIDAEWGFSVSGRPVVPSFNPELHIAKSPLRYNPLLPLVAGLDPGLAGSALIFGQEDLHGRLNVLAELVQSGMGATRIINERLKPFHRLHYPDAKLLIAPDPAAAIRAQSDEKTVVDIFRRFYDVAVESNNRLPLRLDAIEHFTTRLTDVGPALQIDPANCPTLVRALKGGWRYEIDKKRGDEVKGAEPEKNPYSHPGDAFGYLSRYFHRRTLREERYSPTPGGKRFVPPRKFGPSYHWR